MMTEIKVHPIADLFPLLAGEEYESLLTSIGELGQQQPIIVDTKGWLIDGRNRIAACRELGIKPSVSIVDLPEDEIVAHIYAANFARRHMTKGQKAMLVVMAHAEEDVSVGGLAGWAGVGTTYIKRAVYVRLNAPGKVDEIIAGTAGLIATYKELTEVPNVPVSTDMSERALSAQSCITPQEGTKQTPNRTAPKSKLTPIQKALSALDNVPLEDRASIVEYVLALAKEWGITT